MGVALPFFVLSFSFSCKHPPDILNWVHLVNMASQLVMRMVSSIS